MSQVNANTLGDAAGSNTVPIADVINGSAKAWVNFNGTGTVAIRADYNVDSITDNGTGDYTINFTTALTDADYPAVSRIQGAGYSYGVSQTASSVRVQAVNTGGSAVDTSQMSVAVFR